MPFKYLRIKQRFRLPDSDDVLVKLSEASDRVTQVPKYHRKWYNLFIKTTTYENESVQEGTAGYEKWYCGEQHGYGGGTFVKPDQECILV